MEIRCIGDTNTVDAVRLLSIEGEIVSEAEEFLEKLEHTIKKRDRIILVPQGLASRVSDRVEELRDKYPSSIIVEIPDIYGASSRIKDIEKIISTTLGIKI